MQDAEWWQRLMDALQEEVRTDTVLASAKQIAETETSQETSAAFSSVRLVAQTIRGLMRQRDAYAVRVLELERQRVLYMRLPCGSVFRYVPSVEVCDVVEAPTLTAAKAAAGIGSPASLEFLAFLDADAGATGGGTERMGSD